MNIAPSFDNTLLGSTRSKVNADYWETVLDLYEQKKYKEAIIGIIRYVDEELLEKQSDTNPYRFEIPHGSVNIQIQVTDEVFEVTAPFLGTGNSRKIPLLRQVAQINFSPLNLARIVLEGEQLMFTYSSALDLCEPYKTYEVLREICLYADAHDDEFIKKFGATRLQEPEIQRFPVGTLDTVWAKVQSYLEEAKDYIAFFENRRNFGFCWDIINMTLMRIEYYIAPQGALRTEIEKIVSVLQSDGSLTDKVNRGKEFLKKLSQYDRKEFEADIYVAQTFIPYKYRSTLENIRSNFEETYASAKKERDSGDHMAAALSISYVFYKLFYYNNVSDDIAQIVTESLAKASGKPWHEASDHLWKGISQIMTGEQPPKPPKKRGGFFSGLFGK